MLPKKYQTLEEARVALLKLVKKWSDDNKYVSHKSSRIIRLQVLVAHANPLEWLTLQDCSSKIFWENRTQKEQFAGIGVAHEIFDGKVLTQKDENGIVRAHPSQADQFVMIDGLPRELGTYDRLFRNDGLSAGGMPKLVDVTRKSGIKIEREHGLAAVWWDYNDDGYPDLYLSLIHISEPTRPY